MKKLLSSALLAISLVVAPMTAMAEEPSATIPCTTRIQALEIHAEGGLILLNSAKSKDPNLLNSVVEMWVNPITMQWLLTSTSPKDITCMLAYGVNFTEVSILPPNL